MKWNWLRYCAPAAGSPHLLWIPAFLHDLRVLMPGSPHRTAHLKILATNVSWSTSGLEDKLILFDFEAPIELRDLH